MGCYATLYVQKGYVCCSESFNAQGLTKLDVETREALLRLSGLLTAFGVRLGGTIESEPEDTSRNRSVALRISLSSLTSSTPLRLALLTELRLCRTLA